MHCLRHKQKPGALADLDVKRMAQAEDIIAKQTESTVLGNRRFQAVYRQRIFGPDLDIAICGAHRQCRQSITLPHPMGGLPP